MGKRRKNKKNKKKKFYNKKEFVNIFCGDCSLCIGDPTFCYDHLYKRTPKIFIADIHPALLEIKAWNSKRGAFGLDPAQFRYAVCNFVAEEQCNGKEFATNCEHIETCYKEFREQVYGHGGKNLLAHRRGKNSKKTKKKEKAAKYVVKAYPTAFMSDNENWKKVIKRILADGDNNREQDKIEAGSI